MKSAIGLVWTNGIEVETRGACKQNLFPITQVFNSCRIKCLFNEVIGYYMAVRHCSPILPVCGDGRDNKFSSCQMLTSSCLGRLIQSYYIFPEKQNVGGSLFWGR